MKKIPDLEEIFVTVNQKDLCPQGKHKPDERYGAVEYKTTTSKISIKICERCKCLYVEKNNSK